MDSLYNMSHSEESEKNDTKNMFERGDNVKPRQSSKRKKGGKAKKKTRDRLTIKQIKHYPSQHIKDVRGMGKYTKLCKYR